MSVRIYKLGGGGGGLVGEHYVLSLRGGSGYATSQSVLATAPTTITPTTDKVYSAPFIPNNAIVDATFFINVNTPQVGKSARIMIYSNGKNNTPADLLFTEDLSVASSGVRTTTLTFSFDAGTIYWIAFSSDASSAVVSAIPATNLLSLGTKNTGGQQSIFQGMGVFASGAESSFDNYLSNDYSNSEMPLVGVNIP
tara:strand:+ start:2052 stop:2639 length:588 start_codon:yes stop_codon:yes gene_type:complete